MLNIRCRTDGHKDAADRSLCAVIPFGHFKGGQLVLYEPRLVLDIKPGTIVVFPSHGITHFNLDFNGVRGSVVLHTDANAKKWIENSNGWKEFLL